MGLGFGLMIGCLLGRHSIGGVASVGAGTKINVFTLINIDTLLRNEPEPLDSSAQQFVAYYDLVVVFIG